MDTTRWRATESDVEDVGMTVENASLMLVSIDHVGTFADFIAWFKKKQDEANYFKTNNISPIQNDLDEFLTSNLWLARYAEAREIYKSILKQIKSGILKADLSEYYQPTDGMMKECYYINRVELRKYCRSIGLPAGFLLPIDYDQSYEETLKENQRLKAELSSLKNELDDERSYQDKSSPYYLPEVHAVAAGFKHFKQHREKQSLSAKKRGRLWVWEHFPELRTNEAALRRTEEILNWESKPK